jgi:hypothetical protein
MAALSAWAFGKPSWKRWHWKRWHANFLPTNGPRMIGRAARWLPTRVNTGLRQGVAAHVGEVVLIAIPVDVPRADQPFDLFRLQLLAGGLPLQLSDDLVHAAPSIFPVL